MLKFYCMHSREIRCVMFYANGQRCERWLPRGDYEVAGDFEISDGLPGGDIIAAVKLVGLDKKNRGEWYIGRGIIYPEALTDCCDGNGTF